MMVKVIAAGGAWGDDKDAIWNGELPVLLEPGAAFIWKDMGAPVRYKVTMRGIVVDNGSPIYILYVAKQ